MIRKANKNDINAIVDIYKIAQEYMAKNAINQWAKGYPTKEDAADNVEKGISYVLENENGIYGTFVLAEGDDPTYRTIENGEWMSDLPYLTIHRVASNGKERGVFNEIVAFAKSKSDHLRIDTHKDNKHMQELIEQNGFKYCGIIHLLNGSPRQAYEYIK